MAYIYDDSQTYTGEIVNFTSTDKAKITSVSVPITPTQDLHGYDSPWPAGGGVNKFNIDAVEGTPNPTTGSNATSPRVLEFGKFYKGLRSDNYYYPSYASYTISGGVLSVTNGGNNMYGAAYTVEVDGGEDVTVSGVSANGYVSVGWYDSDWNYLSGTTVFAIPHTFTMHANAKCAVFVFRAPANSTATFSNIQIEKGSTAHAWQPYSNICPISGLAGLSVYRTGANVWDEEWELGAFNNSTGAKIASSNTIRSKNPIAIRPETEYCFVSHNAVYLYFYDANGDFLPPYVYKAVSGGKVNFTSPQNACYMNFYAYGTSYSQNKSINYPSTDTEYHAYTGNTYAVDWTTQAGTVYGGTLDVVTGVLTANRITYAFDGTESFTNYATGIVCNKDMPVGYSVAGSDILCSHSTTAYIRFSNSSKSRVEFKKAYFGVSSGDELKAKLAAWSTNGEPLQYSYELATPLTYQLTPKQIAALTENYVWASNGASITVIVSDILHDFQGWLLKVGSGMTLVPTEMIKAETYKVSPNQRMEETAERDSTGVLWRETVPNMPPKIEFNTPAAYDTDVNALNAIFRAAYSNEQERKLTVAFYDPEENVYKTWECYMPNIDFPIRTIDIDAKTIFYDEIRYAFIGY